MTTVPDPRQFSSKGPPESSPPNGDGSTPRPLALERFSAEVGIELSNWELDAVRLAADVQQRRRAASVAKRDGVTRSVLLWALCGLSDPIGAVMASAGLDMRQYEKLLRGFDGSEAAGSDVAESTIVIEPELLEVLRSSLPSLMKVTNLDLARAIMRSGEDGGAGRFASRLRKLNVDVQAATRALGELSQSSSRPGPARVRDDELSRNVRDVRARLGPMPVTASQIAQALQRMHGDYADGKFGSISLESDVGDRRTIDAWLAAVRRHYDMPAVAASRHKVLDEILVLLGLAEADLTLAEQFERAEVLASLRGEADVPTQSVESGPTGPAESDSAEWSPDSPAIKDLLGRAALAKSLAARLKRVDDGPFPPDTILVHIDGPWGSGKSSLFTFLHEELKDAFLVVTVNAWREQRVGVQWWTLLSALQRSIARDSRGFGRVKVWVQGVLDRLRARWVPFVAALIVIFGLGIGILVFGLDKTANEAVLGWISVASLTFAGLVAAARYLLPGAKRSAESLIEHSENPMREIVRLFATTLQRASKPVVFLIDDLDRCDAEYVVEFLEVVQTLVRGAPSFIKEEEQTRDRRRRQRARHRLAREKARVRRAKNNRHQEKRRRNLSAQHQRRSNWRRARRRWRAGWQARWKAWRILHGRDVVAKRRHLTGPHGFVAADGRWIRASYEQHYQQFSTSSIPGRPLGYLFLEKVFQLRVLVPPVSLAARDTYMAALLGTRSEDLRGQEALITAAESEINDASTEEDLLSAQEKVDKVVYPAEHMRLSAKIAGRHSEKGVEDATTNDLARYAALLDQNPRSMKLFVNTYGVLRSLRTLQSLRPQRAPLALWTVMEIRWPELADYLRENPHTVEDLINGRELPMHARELLSQDGVLTVLRDRRWGRLDTEMIRACAGVGGPGASPAPADQ